MPSSSIYFRVLFYAGVMGCAYAFLGGCQIQNEGDPPPIPEATTLFQGLGRAPAHTYRIPTVAVNAQGDVFAFAEKRRHHAGDSGDIDVVMRRLKHNASTWDAEKTVLDFGEKTIGNPCPIMDNANHTLTLLAVSNTVSESQTEPGFGEKSRLVHLTQSHDGGETWSVPEDISRQVKRPSWSWFATGPCSGIILQHPPHRGRYIVGVNHRETAKADTPGYYAHVIYSDDRGKTWHSSRAYAERGTNECEAVEGHDGRLVLNMRNHTRPKYERAVASSSDGGDTFGPTTWHPDLPEPQCMGSIKRYNDSTLLFLNPASKTKRENLTLKFSFDDGKTFPKQVCLDSGFAAYSHMAIRPDGSVVILYEADNYQKIKCLILSAEFMKYYTLF